MSILAGKKGLIFGVANDRSIAAGIAQACFDYGAKLGFTYLPGEKMERRVRQATKEMDPILMEPCDVCDDEQIKAVFQKAKQTMGYIDFVVHSIAFANREDLLKPFYQTSRDGFQLALNISAYSLIALAREYEAIQQGPASLITITYLGSIRAVPKYNVMGVAKAALEASVRYLALDLGKKGIRVNAISAGPIRTLAAMAVGDFQKMQEHAEEKAPLRRNVDQEEVGQAGAYLASDMSSGVTGEIMYVDAGYNIVGV